MRLRFRRAVPIEVSRLRLEPGDVLVVTVPHRLTQAHTETIVDLVQEKVPGHQVMVMPAEFVLSVLSPAVKAAV